MKSLCIGLGWLVGAFLLGTSVALAHQPTESTAVARLQHGRLELRMTMSVEMAQRLAATSVGADIGLDALLPRLRVQAASLFQVKSGAAILSPSLTDVQFNPLGEVDFVLIYPRPTPGAEQMTAAFLEQLPVGYTGTLDVFDDDEKVLANAPRLSRGAATLAWHWAPGASGAENPGLSSGKQLSPAAPSPVATPLNDFMPIGWGLAGTGIFAVWLGWILYRRHRRAMMAVSVPEIPANRLAGRSAP